MINYLFNSYSLHDINWFYSGYFNNIDVFLIFMQLRVQFHSNKNSKCYISATACRTAYKFKVKLNEIKPRFWYRFTRYAVSSSCWDTAFQTIVTVMEIFRTIANMYAFLFLEIAISSLSNIFNLSTHFILLPLYISLIHSHCAVLWILEKWNAAFHSFSFIMFKYWSYYIIFYIIFDLFS